MKATLSKHDANPVPGNLDVIPLTASRQGIEGISESESRAEVRAKQPKDLGPPTVYARHAHPIVGRNHNALCPRRPGAAGRHFGSKTVGRPGAGRNLNAGFGRNLNVLSRLELRCHRNVSCNLIASQCQRSVSGNPTEQRVNSTSQTVGSHSAVTMMQLTAEGVQIELKCCGRTKEKTIPKRPCQSDSDFEPARPSRLEV